ncbi:NAD(P)-binding domain-containing protein, partial [Vibrio alginolyticus]
MSTIAFIGLGRMGHPMAQNLLASGFNVQVFDVDSEAAKQLVPFGAVVASSIEEVVDGASTVITMLPAGSHVRSVYLGDLHGGVGVLNLVSPSTLMIDCSTIDPDSARLVANE